MSAHAACFCSPLQASHLILLGLFTSKSDDCVGFLRLCLLYLQAANFLHEEAARYPRKIHYHNPPDLAMEALEVKYL